MPWTDPPGSGASKDHDADGYSGGNEEGEENEEQGGGSNVQMLFRDDLSELSSIDDSALGDDVRASRYWRFIAEQPVPAPHLAHPEGCATLRVVLITVPRVSRSET